MRVIFFPAMTNSILKYVRALCESRMLLPPITDTCTCLISADLELVDVRALFDVPT